MPTRFKKKIKATQQGDANLIVFSTRLPAGLLQRAKVHCVKTDISLQDLVRTGLLKVLN